MATSLFAKEFSAFNTLNRLSIDIDDQEIFNDALRLCRHYELLFSRTDAQSELFRVNEAKGAPVAVSEELATFIMLALRYCEESGGLFDITMGSAIRLWNFSNAIIPSEEALQEALTHVDYRRVHVQGSTVMLEDPQASIDLGGIAKGYIADGLKDLLVERGVRSGLINLGGNVVTIGEKADGSPWSVGIRMPVSSLQQHGLETFATVSVRDKSVVTSGIYERSFVQDEKLYHHILDPRTGYPAQTDLLGATIVSEKSIDGDGFTTTLIIMGLDKALEFVEQRPGLEAVFVATDGSIYASSAIGEEIPFHMMG